MSHEAHLHQLYAAVSADAKGDELAAFFRPEAEQVEYPSLLRPRGHRRGLDEMLDGAVLGAQLIKDQHYDVHTVIENGDQVAVQLTWTATTTADAGALPAETQLVSHVAAFYVFRDGLVLRQSSYDCYQPIADPRSSDS
jgi:ketosteroid isomerase-like protein